MLKYIKVLYNVCSYYVNIDKIIADGSNVSQEPSESELDDTSGQKCNLSTSWYAYPIPSLQAVVRNPICVQTGYTSMSSFNFICYPTV